MNSSPVGDSNQTLAPDNGRQDHPKTSMSRQTKAEGALDASVRSDSRVLQRNCAHAGRRLRCNRRTVVSAYPHQEFSNGQSSEE